MEKGDPKGPDEPSPLCAVWHCEDSGSGGFRNIQRISFAVGPFSSLFDRLLARSIRTDAAADRADVIDQDSVPAAHSLGNGDSLAHGCLGSLTLRCSSFTLMKNCCFFGRLMLRQFRRLSICLTHSRLTPNLFASFATRP
jgi:hypothetical protein